LGRTKIVCTIGPASSKRSVLEKLLSAGMDVARLNFSHGSHDQHAAVIQSLREVAARMGRPLAILQDLSGPKVRLGTFTAFVAGRGDTIGLTASPEVIATHPVTDSGRVVLPLPVPALFAALRVKSRLLVDDGKVELRVLERDGDVVWTRCVVGGELKPHKGVTALGVAFEVPAVTEKDRADLRFGLQQGVDWVAASYVRCVEDLSPLRAIMAETGRRVPIIAKIEKFEAVRNFASILAAVDGVMVARGDLGVETPFDEVPIVQKRLIRLCNRAGKPVITATQMLESMMQNPRPTRAEAADVANAILDGSDAVMLSGETAAGQFPIEATRTMSRIAVRTESVFDSDGDYVKRLAPPSDATHAVARATANIACEINAAAILCATSSGKTARAVAQYRPRMRIVAVTSEKAVYHQLALTWGVVPVLSDAISNTDGLFEATINAAVRSRQVKEGDMVVISAGVPVNVAGNTNLIKVHKIGDRTI